MSRDPDMDYEQRDAILRVASQSTVRYLTQPRTEAGQALMSIFPLYAQRICAIEEQAATEARRELLVKVEGLPTVPGDYSDVLESDDSVDRAAVLRLVEEQS